MSCDARSRNDEVMLVFSLVSGGYIFKGDVKFLGNIDLASVPSKVPHSSTQVWVHPADSHRAVKQ